MTPTGTEIYKRTATYDRDATSIRLHAPQWKLLLAFDGQRALTDAALQAGMPFPEAATQSESFLKNDWIAEQPITLEEFLRRNSGGGSTPAAPPLSAEARVDATPAPAMQAENRVEVKPESAPEPKVETKAAPAPEPQAERKTDALPVLQPAGDATVPIPVVGPPPRETPVLAPRGPMRLSAIVDFIVGLAESIPLGHLLAYRVFLRVPPEILQSEDIVSIHLVDDTSLVRTGALQKAIANAIMEIVKRPLPDSVYAAA